MSKRNGTIVADDGYKAKIRSTVFDDSVLEDDGVIECLAGCTSITLQSPSVTPNHRIDIINSTGEDIDILGVGIPIGNEPTGNPTSVVLKKGSTITLHNNGVEYRIIEGSGVFDLSEVELISGTGITIEPTNNGAIIYVNPTAGDIDLTLDTASNYKGKTFTFKRVVNGGNFAKFTPDIGEFIDNISSLYYLALGRKNDAITIYSDGTNWSILSRYTTNLAIIQCVTPGTTQALTLNTEVEIDCFDFDVTSSYGRLTADAANNKIIIENKEDLATPYHIHFKIIGEFSANSTEFDMDLYIGGVFSERLASQFLQKQNKNYTILGDTTITFLGAVPSDITVRITSDKSGTFTYVKASLVVNGTRG